MTDGAGCEVVTATELALAQNAGCPPERLVMNGVGKTDADHTAAIQAGALINAESLQELDALLALGASRIGLRLNPGLSPDTHAHLATGAADSKFGISWTDLDAALDRIRAAGRQLESVGAHVGSAIDDVGTYALLAERLAEAAGRAGAERINLGGGAGVGLSVTALADAVRPHMPDPTRLILEPGRSLVADGGWLVTRVVRVQPRPEAGLTYLVADAGMAELIRPVLYGADHAVALLAPGQPLKTADATIHLAGPVCEAGDIVVHDIGRWLSAAELALTGTGALLAIGQVGAYGAAMASVYNGRPRPAEAVLDPGSWPSAAGGRPSTTCSPATSRAAGESGLLPGFGQAVAGRLSPSVAMPMAPPSMASTNAPASQIGIVTGAGAV
jgi:diaminopimelate decarboxylase